MCRVILLPCLLGLCSCLACGVGRKRPTEGSGITSVGPDGATEGTTGSEATTAVTSVGDGTAGPGGSETNGAGSTGAGDGGGPLFDVGGGGATATAGDSGPSNCRQADLPAHTPCDDGTTDPFHAMGIGCPGEEPEPLAATVTAHPKSVGTRTSFGPTSTFDPREGSSMAVLSTGFIEELDFETPDSDAEQTCAGNPCPHWNPTYANDDVDCPGDVGGLCCPPANPCTYDDWDHPPGELPPPLDWQGVGDVDCSEDPSLVGTGDCSNTIQTQFGAGNTAEDYAELRLETVVPNGATSFRYDLFFLSTEYPYYYGKTWNDMYVGWLESEMWTGNVSFDDMGNPISLNAVFLEYKDDDGTLPEFDGTAMRFHAGTGWLTTTAPVTPGETITLVFAIWDRQDSQLDSFAFLDNFRWGCEGPDKPDTKPEG